MKISFEEYLDECYIAEAADLRNFAKVAKVFGGTVKGDKESVEFNDLKIQRTKGRVKKFGPKMRQTSAILKFRLDVSNRQAKIMRRDLQTEYRKKGIMSFGASDLKNEEHNGVVAIELGPYRLFNTNPDMLVKKAKIIKKIMNDYVEQEYEL